MHVYWMRLIAGFGFAIGLGMYLYSFLVARKTRSDAPALIKAA